MNDNRFEKAAVTLQFDKILQMLADCATTEGAKLLCKATEPESDIRKITALQNETSDAEKLYRGKGEPSFGYVKDITPMLSWNQNIQKEEMKGFHNGDD